MVPSSVLASSLCSVCTWIQCRLSFDWCWPPNALVRTFSACGYSKMTLTLTDSSKDFFSKPSNICAERLTDRASGKCFRLGLWTVSWETTGKYRVNVNKRQCQLSSVQIALAVSAHLGLNLVDLGRVGQRPLYRGQIGSKNVRVSQINDRKGRWPSRQFLLYMHEYVCVCVGGGGCLRPLKVITSSV